MLRTLGGVVGIGGSLALIAYALYFSGEIYVLWATLFVLLLVIHFPWPYADKRAFSDLGGIVAVGGSLGITAYALYYSGRPVVLWMILLVTIIAIKFPWSYKIKQRQQKKKKKAAKKNT